MYGKQEYAHINALLNAKLIGTIGMLHPDPLAIGAEDVALPDGDLHRLFQACPFHRAHQFPLQIDIRHPLGGAGLQGQNADYAKYNRGRKHRNV